MDKNHEVVSSPVVWTSRTLHHLAQHRVILVLYLRMMLVHVRSRVDPSDDFGWVAGHDSVFLHVLQTPSQLIVRHAQSAVNSP